mmetsp:Transcript_24835/g.98612  ORF Transcript_24835/g.98612 Transcript_24835/m.98612 type:complete len:218 (+) Transcript_24835:323-976(+)
MLRRAAGVQRDLRHDGEAVRRAVRVVYQHDVRGRRGLRAIRGHSQAHAPTRRFVRQVLAGPGPRLSVHRGGQSDDAADADPRGRLQKVRARVDRQGRGPRREGRLDQEVRLVAAQARRQVPRAGEAGPGPAAGLLRQFDEGSGGEERRQGTAPQGRRRRRRRDAPRRRRRPRRRGGRAGFSFERRRAVGCCRGSNARSPRHDVVLVGALLERGSSLS